MHFLVVNLPHLLEILRSNSDSVKGLRLLRPVNSRL